MEAIGGEMGWILGRKQNRISDKFKGKKANRSSLHVMRKILSTNGMSNM